jgi:hypothetical protein
MTAVTDDQVLAEIAEHAARDTAIADQLRAEGTPNRAVFLDRAADYWAHLARVVRGEVEASDNDKYALAWLRGPREKSRRIRHDKEAAS